MRAKFPEQQPAIRGVLCLHNGQTGGLLAVSPGGIGRSASGNGARRPSIGKTEHGGPHAGNGPRHDIAAARGDRIPLEVCENRSSKHP